MRFDFPVSDAPTNERKKRYFTENNLIIVSILVSAGWGNTFLISQMFQLFVTRKKKKNDKE